MKFRTASAALPLAAVAPVVSAVAATAVPATPDASSPSVIQAHGPEVFPHSVDYDPRSKQFLVGSLKHSTISAVGPDGTAYVVDELNPTVFRIDSHGHTSAFLHSKLPAGAVTIPNPLSGVSSRLLTGKPAVVARVRPHRRWNTAAVTNTNTVSEPVTDSISAGPGGSTHALSGGLAALLTGKPDDGFVLTPVRVQSR